MSNMRRRVSGADEVASESDDVVPPAARIPLSLFIVLVVAYTLVAPNFDQPFLQYSFAAAVVFLFVAKPAAKQWIAAALVAAGFTAVHDWLVRGGTTTGPSLSLYAGMLGRGALVILCLQAVWADSIEGRRWRKVWPIPIGVLAFVLASLVALNVTVAARLRVLDAYLYVFDGSLGFQPSFVLGRIFWRYKLVSDFANLIYCSLPVAIALVCAGYLKNRSPWRLLGILASAGVMGYALYFVFPATGPRYVAGASFPAAPHPFATLAQIHPHPLALPIPAPRNAIPSLHMAWALLLWFNCRPLSRIARGLSLLYVVLTLFVTLGTGEHYFVDLVVALPFAVAIQALWGQGSARYRIVAEAAVLTLLWLAALRYGTSVFLTSPIIPWACVVVSSVMALGLARASSW